MMQEINLPALNESKGHSSPSIFQTVESFEHWQRIAKMISTSDLVPQNYRNNIPNTMLAIELSQRIGISPFMVMQNLDIIKGKPAWSSTFIISALNSCGRFKPLRFKFEGNEGSPEYGCRAMAIDIETNEVIIGPIVTMKMVKDEGWLDKPGSKWKTMPELMFQYRSASFFGRLYAPDILKGMHSTDEVVDIVTITKPSIKRTQEEQERQNVLDHINDSDTIEKLEEVKLIVKQYGLENEFAEKKDFLTTNK